MVFKAGKWELFLLLVAGARRRARTRRQGLRLAGDPGPQRHHELAAYPGPPVEWLLYSEFAVIVTLSTTYITYTTIPIYAAMKAIEPAIFEAATDLGAGWWPQAQRILIPLAAPGIFIAMILVYIPMLTDFVTSDIVGGTGLLHDGSARPRSDPRSGDWGAGSALNFILLVLSGSCRLCRVSAGRVEQDRGMSVKSHGGSRRTSAGEIVVDAVHQAFRRRGGRQRRVDHDPRRRVLLDARARADAARRRPSA